MGKFVMLPLMMSIVLYSIFLAPKRIASSLSAKNRVFADHFLWTTTEAMAIKIMAPTTEKIKPAASPWA